MFKFLNILAFQLSDIPDDIDQVTNHVTLLNRDWRGTAQRLNLGLGQNYRIPSDGFISAWEFYSDGPGEASLQVWRPRPEQGSDR